MSDNDKYAAAVFFISAGNERTGLVQLLRKAGATAIEGRQQTRADPSGLMLCTWAGMTCRSCTFERIRHQILHIFFLRSALLGDLGTPLDRRAASTQSDLASAFKYACLSLAPDVAFVADRRGQGDPDWTLAHEASVRTGKADDLLAQCFGLLYLHAAYARKATPAILKTFIRVSLNDGWLYCSRDSRISWACADASGKQDATKSARRTNTA